MKQLEFKIIIDAPREVVWNILIGIDTYPIWTSVFSENSKVETDWKVGSKALFRTYRHGIWKFIQQQFRICTI
ncbi:MAG: hypothetical protein EOO43_06580 [Flavobacterium sp.]|nr:MAG: hypothetical protein EOO43_06580 [Flavobacterium sp.]